MIAKQEILALAAELQLQPHVVEKDYALGWFLAGISAHPVIGPRWVFKGGTCLKKCYFKTKSLHRMVQFAQAFVDAEFVATLSRHLRWSHVVALFTPQRSGPLRRGESSTAFLVLVLVFPVHVPRWQESTEYRGPAWKNPCQPE